MGICCYINDIIFINSLSYLLSVERQCFRNDLIGTQNCFPPNLSGSVPTGTGPCGNAVGGNSTTSSFWGDSVISEQAPQRSPQEGMAGGLIFCVTVGEVSLDQGNSGAYSGFFPSFFNVFFSPYLHQLHLRVLPYAP